MWGSRGVGKWQFGGIAVWGIRGVGEWQCGGVAVRGSRGLGVLQCGGNAVCGSCSVRRSQRLPNHKSLRFRRFTRFLRILQKTNHLKKFTMAKYFASAHFAIAH